MSISTSTGPQTDKTNVDSGTTMSSTTSRIPPKTSPARINPIFPQWDRGDLHKYRKAASEYISSFLAAPGKNTYIKAMENLLKLINNTNTDDISGTNRKLYYALYYECLEGIFNHSGREFYPPDYRYVFRDAFRDAFRDTNNGKPVFYRAREVGSKCAYADINTAKEAMNLLRNVKIKHGQNKKTQKTHMTVSQPVHVIDKNCKLPAESIKTIYLDTADGEIVVLADIHATLRPEFLIRILSEAMEQGKRVVNLGDAINRGAYTLETLLILFAFRLKFPDKIFLMRGNHETSPIARVYWQTNAPTNFSDKLAFLALLEEMFAKLPIFCILLTQDSNDSVKLIYCVHGACSPMHLLLQRKEWLGVGLLTVMTGAGLATTTVIEGASLNTFAPIKFGEVSTMHTEYVRMACEEKWSQQEAQKAAKLASELFDVVAKQDHPLWNENPFTRANPDSDQKSARCERGTNRGGAGIVAGIETLASLSYASGETSAFMFGHNHKLSVVKLPSGSLVIGISSCGPQASRGNQLFSWSTINKYGVPTAHAINFVAEGREEIMFGNEEVTNGGLEALGKEEVLVNEIVNPQVDLKEGTGFVRPEEVTLNEYETNITNFLVDWASTLPAQKASSSSSTLATSPHTLYGASSSTQPGELPAPPVTSAIGQQTTTPIAPTTNNGTTH